LKIFQYLKKIPSPCHHSWGSGYWLTSIGGKYDLEEREKRGKCERKGKKVERKR
jgi:hypothetical protein